MQLVGHGILGPLHGAGALAVHHQAVGRPRIVVHVPNLQIQQVLPQAALCCGMWCSALCARPRHDRGEAAWHAGTKVGVTVIDRVYSSMLRMLSGTRALDDR